MRRIRYSVAMSLDGFIAGPKREFDWIKTDPDFDFSAMFKQFDTIVAGRGTFEPMAAAGRTSMPGMKTIVVSRTLRPEDHPDVVIVPGIEALTDLKASPGKDIWLFGGGKLFAASPRREWWIRWRFPSHQFSWERAYPSPRICQSGSTFPSSITRFIRRELFRWNMPFAL